MSNVSLTKEDLELAWTRVKKDSSDHYFTNHPFEIDLIENELDNWLEELLEKFNSSNYYPSSLYTCDVPKSHGLIRRGSKLQLSDAVIFYALIGISMEQIYHSLDWARGIVELSYQLEPEYQRTNWIKNRFRCWNEFREKSLEAFDEDTSHVIIADITAYYDNIDVSRLSSDLRQIGIDQEVVSTLSKCLNKWSVTEGRGIPQGSSGSHILAKIYLNSIDLLFHSKDVKYLRYVDDIRIFCTSLSEARKALIDLSTSLRNRGLSLQSAKTRIHPAHEARKIIDGIHPTLAGVRDEFIEEIKGVLENLGPYASIPEIDDEIEDREIEDSPEVLERAFDEYIAGNEDDFDKSLFHFLLNRLGNLNNNHAVNFCIQLLRKKPEETSSILSYFLKLNLLDKIQKPLLDFLNEDESVYYFQKYEIIQTIHVSEIELNDDLVEYIREESFKKDNPSYYKSICIAVLRNYTNPADLERLQRIYPDVRNNLEQAEIIIALKNLERARRNYFYSQVENDGFYTRNAVQKVKEVAI